MSGGKSARPEVEIAKVILKIHVQSRIAGGSGFIDGDREQTNSDAPPPNPLRNSSVQDERVHGAVPGDIHESNQRAIRAGADPPEAVPAHSPPPVVLPERMIEALGMQRIELGVVDLAPPLERDRHQPS